MKATFNTEKLKKALTLLCSVIPKQTRLPILLHVRIQILNEKHALFCSTNESVFMFKKVPLESYDSDGACTIDAKNFLELVKKFKKDLPVSLNLMDDNTVKVSQSKSRYSFRTMNAFTFPDLKIPKQEFFHKMSAEALSTVLKKVESSSGDENYAEALRSVYLEPTSEEGFFRSVASNGVQLTTCKAPGVIAEAVSIPKAAVPLLIKTLADVEDCELYSDGARVYVMYEGGLFCSRLTNKKFPDYKKLFSKGSSVHINLDLEPVRSSLKRALLFSDRILVTIQPDGRLSLSSYDAKGDAQEELTLSSKIEKLQHPLNIGINGGMFLDLLNKFEGESVSMFFYGEKSPLSFQGSPNVVGLFMPLQNR